MLAARANQPPAPPASVELPVVEVFRTQLGWMALQSVSDCLLGLTFGHRSSSAARRALDKPIVTTCNGGLPDSRGSIDPDDLRDRLGRFAEGERVEFGDVPIDVAPLTPFARRVVATCRRVAWGQTCSYGELARLSERPGAARAVGTVMARNRFPLVVPCHRVLGAGGKLGGYSAPEGLVMKRRLLAMEAG